MTALVWIQREFRTDYLPSLNEALSKHDNVIVAYFHDASSPLGRASALWLGHALEALQKKYNDLGGRLWIAQGKFEASFQKLIETHKITQVYYCHQVGHTFVKNQQSVLTLCQKHHVYLQPFYSEDFFNPCDIKTLKAEPYLVFTPFYKNCLTKLDQLTPLLPTINAWNKTANIAVPLEYRPLPEDLKVLQKTSWAKKMMQHWRVGEQAAWQNFETFLSHISDYSEERDYPSITATSRLSPYLHFGHINPVTLYFEIQVALEAGQLKWHQAEPWVRQLFWRSFSRYLLTWFPFKEELEFNKKYRGITWDYDEVSYKAWCRGQTGIPIIDAGMRELWETGTMHNRVRMLVASVLTKNMNHDWRQGLRWFEETLFDADPANNAMGWQWVAGTGVDAAPYYRLFNPVLQSQKFDSQGEYIKKWVPELKALSSKSIHEPWNFQAECISKNIYLGKDYPKPLIDLEMSRTAHLKRVEQLKQS